jgi:hypothetical protein
MRDGSRIAVLSWPLYQRHNIARSPKRYFSNARYNSGFSPSGAFHLTLSGLLVLLHLSMWVCKCISWWRLCSNELRNFCPQSLQTVSSIEDFIYLRAAMICYRNENIWTSFRRFWSSLYRNKYFHAVLWTQNHSFGCRHRDLAYNP